MLTDTALRDVNNGQKSFETLDALIEHTGSRTEAVAILIEMTASSDFMGTHGESIVGLAGWNEYLRSRCSERYQALATVLSAGQNPSRQEVNQDKLLQDLNGIRRGVHRALVRQHGLSKRRKRLLSELHAEPKTIDPDFFEYRS